MGRRAQEYLGEDVVFSVFSRQACQFLALPRSLAAAALEGELDLAPALAAPARKGARLADLAMSGFRGEGAHGAKFLLRFLDSLGVEQVLRLTEALGSELGPPPGGWPADPALALEPLRLGPDDTIVSGGLDWDHKDLFDIQRLRRRLGFRYVAILYDLIPLLFPHFVVPSYVSRLTGYFGELFWTADQLLCISETTAADARRYVARLRLPPPRIDSFPLGGTLPVGEADARLPTEVAGRTYALYVSTIEPRKNHRLLYEALQRMLAAGHAPEGATLVFVGRIGWNVDNLLHEIRINPATRDRVVIMSDVADETLAALYRSARMVLFPSFYEGFGLPLAEALAFGKACLASDAPALVEVSRGRARHLAPDDPAAWAEAMARLFRDDAAVAELERRAAGATPQASWGDAAAVFFGAVRDGAGSVGRGVRA